METAARQHGLRNAAGDTGWITALVRAHRIRLLGLARRSGLGADEAFDCVQEAFGTFLRLPQAEGLAERADEAARLLNTIVRNAARTMRRRAVAGQRRGEGAPALEAVPDERAPRADELIAGVEARSSLARCVMELSELQQSVVRLRMLEELPGDQVAAALGISPQNVAVVLHRAKASLRGCLTAAGHCADGCW